MICKLVNNNLLETGKNYVNFLKIDFLSNNMHIKLIGFGILSLFLVMMVPVYAEITEFSIEKRFYTVEEGIVFVGTTDQKNAMINVIVENPNKKESYFIGTRSNSEGIFETTPKNVSDFFTTIGIYQFTAFTIQNDDGISLSLEF